jgi:hypothetical protein
VQGWFKTGTIDQRINATAERAAKQARVNRSHQTRPQSGEARAGH